MRRFASAATRRIALDNVAGMALGKNSNITSSIAEKVGRNLHHVPKHPLRTIKGIIEGHFEVAHGGKFRAFDNLSPIVSTQQCFDDLLTPKDHVSRLPTDTYYIDDDHVLRTHTSAHQTELMRAGERHFLCTGDVYRRDEIDASHYPVFHQMEGVKLFTAEELPCGVDGDVTSPECIGFIRNDLQETLGGMVKTIFGDNIEMRWVDAFFPFTEPSIELEIFFKGDWLEVLGCGVIRREILSNCDLSASHGWAFGLGLERLAMVLFGIPDIRLFWSEDSRFIDQFEDGQITIFQPFSKYPPCFKDVSFWLPQDFHENDLCSVVRDVTGDIVEDVSLIDEFTQPKSGRTSHCYRITYRHMERTLTDAEVDEMQYHVRERLAADMGCELR